MDAQRYRTAALLGQRSRPLADVRRVQGEQAVIAFTITQRFGQRRDRVIVIGPQGADHHPVEKLWKSEAAPSDLRRSVMVRAFWPTSIAAVDVVWHRNLPHRSF